MVPRSGAARGFLALCGALLAVACVSCSGSNLASVHGKVLYKGSPVQGAVVTFHPKDENDLKTVRPSGITDQEGNFTLGTGNAEGAPVGEYIVTVNWYRPVESPEGKKASISTESPPPPPDYFAAKTYSVRDKSALRATVNSGTNNLEPFRLD